MLIGVHGDRSAVPNLEHFAGIEDNLTNYKNSLVAQYYGVKHVIASK